MHYWASSVCWRTCVPMRERRESRALERKRIPLPLKHQMSLEWINSFLKSKHSGNQVFIQGLKFLSLVIMRVRNKVNSKKVGLDSCRGVSLILSDRLESSEGSETLLRESPGSWMCCVLLLAVMNPCGGVRSICLQSAIRQVLKARVFRWQVGVGWQKRDF